MRRLPLALICISVLSIWSFGESPTARASARQNRALLLNPDAPEFQAPAPAVSHLALDTSRGTVLIEVIRDWGPRGADRFYNLARLGYYDENRFFRVNPGRWTQFGVNGDPAIAKTWRTRTFPDDPFKTSNTRGTVAFAFAQPNGRTTQIFFNLGDNRPTHDPPSKDVFVPFGRVITGMDVVDSFNAEYREGPGGIRAGKQDPFFEGGNEWLLKEFPRLDYIKKVQVVVH